ncbi:hypothetical protein OROMI_014776 [Orobanche minor]
MDRNWINAPRLSKEYKNGVTEFCKYATQHAKDIRFILCPCQKCLNVVEVNGQTELYEHLICHGIDRTYTFWKYHGEDKVEHSSSNWNSNYQFVDTDTNVMADIEGSNSGDEKDIPNVINEELHDHPDMHEKLKHDAALPLWPGCTKASKLSAVLTLYNLKAGHQVSDVFFTELLTAISELLPDGNVLPRRTYEAKQMLKSIGLIHDRIHACPNDCILYRKEYAELDECPKCGTKRYKDGNYPAKIMWYFPLIPRRRRLYASAKDAKHLTWHHDGRIKDGMLRHPSDSPQWKTFDNTYQDFGKEPRNIRLALSTDGMNPYKLQNNTHSTWPVILIIYNLAPWLCMKRKYMMMSILISGPTQPGNDIDVYLAPLIEDLKLLWEEGIEVRDEYRKDQFRLKAMLFGTINDFPAYGNLSGYSVKGYDACPWCGEEIDQLYLKHCKKCVYMGHRRWLDSKHRYRNMPSVFNGEVEERGAPPKKTGADVLKEVENLNVQLGKKFAKDVPTKVGTLLGVPGKANKDGYNARMDMKEMGIRDELIPNLLPIAIRSILPEKVRVTITKLCWFFKSISSKVIDPRRLSYLQRQIVETLCEVEMYFPPSFFDVMVHLTVHLIYETRMCGPSRMRWMYPVERYLKILKDYVMNRSRPEGCIAERYLIEEAIEFWSEFIPNVEAIGLPSARHNGRVDGEGVTGGQQVEIDSAQWHRVHLCVLHNSVDVVPFVDLHKQTLSLEHPGKCASWIEVEHNQHDATSTMQNSGVAITATALHQSSSDANPVLADTTYFGRIENIWELDYVGFRVPVFDCSWVNNASGVHVEDLGFIRVDLERVGYKDDSFIMATQAQQVFYVIDPVDKKWSIVVFSNKLNNSYQVTDGVDEEVDNIDDPFSGVIFSTIMNDDDEYECFYSRNDHDEGEYVNPEFQNVRGHKRSNPIKKRKRKSKSKKCMIMTGGSHDTTGTIGTNGTSVTDKSAKRGVVNMLKVKKARTKGIVQKVNWNEMGQPIGKESMTLAHFIGSYVRRHVPITCDNWRNKDLLNVKQALWDEIKETFNGVEEEHRKKIISRAGNLHRPFRTRLRTLARDENGNYSTSPPPLYAHFSTVTPCWKEFVQKSSEVEFLEKSSKNKERAKAMEARYRKACVGYARLREIIINEKIKKGEQNPVVTRLDAWEYARRNAEGVVDDPVAIQILEDVLPFQISCQNMDNHVEEGYDGHIDVSLGEALPQGKNPCYLYLDPGRRYVGQGILHNDLNDGILHGVPIEEGYVRVQFEVAEKSELKSQLPRPCDEANLVGEAPGYFLAWPRKLVSMKLEHSVGHENLKDPEKERTLESIAGVSSKQLGYPLPEDVIHDGVLEVVRLVVMFDRVTDIEVDMGPFWNADPWIEHINKENVLEVLDTQWLSASSLVFYIRYLCEVYLSTNPDFINKFSFASPHRIVSPLVDSSEASTHLAKCMLRYVDKDHLLLVPYNVSKHWVLVAINTTTESIYFMDPAPMTTIAKYRSLKALVENAMRCFRTNCGRSCTRTAFNAFKWTTIQCPKQLTSDGISCGYYVGCYIEDLLRSAETSIGINFTRPHKLKFYSPDKMVRFQKNWAGYLYNRFLKGKLLK